MQNFLNTIKQNVIIKRWIRRIVLSCGFLLISVRYSLPAKTILSNMAYFEFLIFIIGFSVDLFEKQQKENKYAIKIASIVLPCMVTFGSTIICDFVIAEAKASDEYNLLIDRIKSFFDCQNLIGTVIALLPIFCDIIIMIRLIVNPVKIRNLKIEQEKEYISIYVEQGNDNLLGRVIYKEIDDLIYINSNPILRCDIFSMYCKYDNTRILKEIIIMILSIAKKDGKKYFAVSADKYANVLQNKFGFNIPMEIEGDIYYSQLTNEKCIDKEKKVESTKGVKDSVKMNFDIDKALKTFRHKAIKNGEYTAWKKGIQNDLKEFEKHELNDLKVVLQIKLEYLSTPDKFDLKTIICNIIIPVFLAVIIAIYTIFNNEQNSGLVFNVSMDIFILVLILMIPIIIIEHLKNKKTVKNTYAIKKLLEIIENLELVAKDKRE